MHAHATPCMQAETSSKEGYEAIAVQLQEVLAKLGEEKARSEALLCRCLPREVARKLQAGEAVPPTLHSNLTIMFADIVR